MKKDRFFVWLPCKTYVKVWLVINFPSPDNKWPEAVNISSDLQLSNALKEKLSKPSTRYEKRMATNSKYTERIPIEISQDTFYRYGWELSATETNNFNQLIENRIKSDLLRYLELSVSFGSSIAAAIRGWYELSGFNDITFPSESIRKFFLRHRSENCKKNNFLQKQINIIFMENMPRK